MYCNYSQFCHGVDPSVDIFDQQKWSCVMYMLVMITKLKSGALIRCINFPRNKWLLCDEKLNGSVRINLPSDLWVFIFSSYDKSVVSRKQYCIIYYMISSRLYIVLPIQGPDSQQAGMGIHRIEIITMKCIDIRLTLNRWLSTRLQ